MISIVLCLWFCGIPECQKPELLILFTNKISTTRGDYTCVGSQISMKLLLIILNIFRMFLAKLSFKKFIWLSVVWP